MTISDASCRNVSVSYVLVEGSRHSQQGLPCEDVVVVRESGDCLFCGIADGKSGALYGAEGGRASLESVFDYIAAVGIDSILNAPFPDELPCAMTKAFRRALLSLSEEKSVDRQEFASTLLAMIMDLKTGKFVLLHLGDGCAVSIPREEEPVLFSCPENGISSSYTWLTTSENAVSHLRIYYGSAENKKRMLLASDGASCFFSGRNIPWRIKELLKNGSDSEIIDQLIKSKPSDDAACIVLDFQANPA